MTADTSTLLAILGMTLATYLTRAGGYWLFRVVHPPRAMEAAFRYIPGALFVSYITPALLDGGPVQWVGAAATVALMVGTGRMPVAILGGVGAAWLVWSLR